MSGLLEIFNNLGRKYEEIASVDSNSEELLEVYRRQQAVKWNKGGLTDSIAQDTDLPVLEEMHNNEISVDNRCSTDDSGKFREIIGKNPEYELDKAGGDACKYLGYQNIIDDSSRRQETIRYDAFSVGRIVTKGEAVGRKIVRYFEPNGNYFVTWLDKLQKRQIEIVDEYAEDPAGCAVKAILR